MNQRLQNYDNYKQLWDYYTGTAGMSPVEAASNLANVHAESRANPGALNPRDGSDGSDSRGILQWNAGRASRLDRFAKERGATANDLMLQAQYQVWESMEGPERANYARARQIIEETGDPAKGAMAIASEYIRPASQHIPQRGEYGKMFYDMFAGGNPNGVQPGLQYSPQQGEDLSREQARVQGDPNRLRFDLPGDGQDANAILRELAKLSRPSPAPQISTTPPGLERMQGAMDVVGPRQTMASPDMPAPSPPPSVQSTRPALPGSGDERGPGGGAPYSTPTRPQGPPSRPVPVEELPEGISQFDAVARTVGADTALDMGIDPEEAPKTVAEAKQVAQSSPNEGDSEEEAERKERRRLHAAQMLETLSVGLGQMSTRGGPVSLGGTLQNQRAEWERRDIRTQEQEAKEQELAQQAQQAQVLAQNLAGMGETGLARMAMSGPDGFATAAQAYQTLSTRKPSEVDAFAQLTPEGKMRMLTAAGADTRTASVLSAPGNEDLAQDFLRTTLIDERGDQEEKDRLYAQAQRMGERAMPLAGSNPAVATALDQVGADPYNQENINNLRDAIVEAGGEAPGQPLSPFMADLYGKQLGLTEEQILAAQQDPEYAEQIKGAAAEGLVRQAEAAGDQTIDQRGAQEAADRLVDNGIITPDEGKLVAELGQEAGMTEVRNRRAIADAQRGRAATQQVAQGVAQTFKMAVPKAQHGAIDGLFANVETDQQLSQAVRTADEKFGLPEQVKTALAANENPVIRNALIDLKRAESGAKTPELELAASRLESLEERSNTLATNIDTARPLVRSMGDVVGAVTAPGYDRTSGGPFDSILAFAQSAGNQIFGPEFSNAIMADDQVFAFRQLEAQVGQYFSNFRATGSGSTSDMESKNFMRAMPNVGDNSLKQAGLAQRVIRAQKVSELELAARREFAYENLNDPKALGDEDALNKYIDERIGSANIDTFPELNQGEEGYMKQLAADISSGNVRPDTVIRVAPSDGPAYYGFADEVLIELVGEDRASAIFGR